MCFLPSWQNRLLVSERSEFLRNPFFTYLQKIIWKGQRVFSACGPFQKFRFVADLLFLQHTELQKQISHNSLCFKALKKIFFFVFIFFSINFIYSLKLHFVEKFWALLQVLFFFQKRNEFFEQFVKCHLFEALIGPSFWQ